MTTISPDLTLGTLVTERPHLAARLDHLGLDYCCGGQRTLGEAVTAAGLDLDEVVARLAQGADDSTRPDWADLGPTALIEHLETTHHAYLHDELPRLEALAAKVADVHGERHPELVEVRRLVAEVRAELEPHLRKEEQVLFPMIRELDTAVAAPSFHCGSLRNPVSVMLLEHDRAGELLAELERATDGHRVPADGCASYQALYAGLAELAADTHLHVHKENNVLFPKVLAAEDAVAVGS